MAKLGLICSIYNDTSYLQDLFRSCENIQVEDLNVYFVDDNSTVDLKPYFDQFLEQHKNFKLLANTSNYLGGGSARNSVLDAVDDKYVGFIDADDFVDPAYHRQMLDLMERYELDCIKTNWTVFQDGSRIRSKLEDVIPQNEVLPGVKFFSPYNKSNLYDRPHSCMGLYRKDFLDKNEIRFSNIFSAEDRLFWTKCLLFADRVLATEIDDGYFYRKESQSNRLTAVGNKIQNEYFKAASEIVEFCLKHDVPVDAWRKIITQIVALTDYHYRSRERLSGIAQFDLYYKCSELITLLKRCPEYEYVYSKISKQRKEMIKIFEAGNFRYE